MKLTSLKRNNDFVRAYKKGKSYVDALVVLYVNKNRTGQTRVGITASKKVGNAVKRNRSRRVIRHALYNVLPKNVGGYDLILVARGKTPYVKSPRVEESLQKLFVKAGLMAAKPAGDKE